MLKSSRPPQKLQAVIILQTNENGYITKQVGALNQGKGGEAAFAHQQGINIYMAKFKAC